MLRALCSTEQKGAPQQRPDAQPGPELPGGGPEYPEPAQASIYQ